jgi:parvulin-like peptidyl-prolyl isomerase
LNTEAPNPFREGRWLNFNAVNSRRSLVLLAAGALSGLIMAGYALFTARGTSTLVVPPEDVALVNQQPISRSDYLQQLQTLFAVDLAHSTPAERSKVLNDMIREELFVQRAKELDLASIDPEVRGAMVNAVELEIAADAITAQPTESQLRAYYAANRTRYASEGSMILDDYVFPSNAPNAAAQAAEFLKSSAVTPALLAQWHASNSGKVTGEEFYFAAKLHLGDALFEVAQKLPDRGVSAPIPREDGIHVLYMVYNKKPVPLDFQTAQAQVLSDFRNDAIGHLRTQDETFLRKRANIVIADDLR